MPEIYSPSSEHEVADFIKNCNSQEIPIEITGHNSKPIGRLIQCSKSLNLKNLSGIIEYFPEELYIKVKAGTPLALIEAELDKKNQELSFEPSDMGFLYNGKSNKGSVGGAVACNLSGSRRFRAGALRDHIHGLKKKLKVIGYFVTIVIIAGQSLLAESNHTCVTNVDMTILLNNLPLMISLNHYKTKI